MPALVQRRAGIWAVQGERDPRKDLLRVPPRSDITGNIAIALTSGKLHPASPGASLLSDDSRNYNMPPCRRQWAPLSRKMKVAQYSAPRYALRSLRMLVGTLVRSVTLVACVHLTCAACPHSAAAALDYENGSTTNPELAGRPNPTSGQIVKWRNDLQSKDVADPDAGFREKRARNVLDQLLTSVDRTPELQVQEYTAAVCSLRSWLRQRAR